MIPLFNCLFILCTSPEDGASVRVFPFLLPSDVARIPELARDLLNEGLIATLAKRGFSLDLNQFIAKTGFSHGAKLYTVREQ